MNWEKALTELNLKLQEMADGPEEHVKLGNAVVTIYDYIKLLEGALLKRQTEKPQQLNDQ